MKNTIKIHFLFLIVKGVFTAAPFRVHVNQFFFWPIIVTVKRIDNSRIRTEN